MAKNVVAALCAVVLGAAGVTNAAAQDINALVKDAIDTLSESAPEHMTICIEPLTIGESEAVADLSAFLDGKIRLFAANNPRFTVTRGLDVTDRTLLGGSYTIGAKVIVTLTSTADERELARASFTITRAELEQAGIALLPANFTTQKAVEQTEAIIESAVSSDSFNLDVWGDKETRVYYHGEELTLTLVSEKDCYFKVYHIDVHSNMKMVYPNKLDKNNKLSAGKTRTIPEKTAFKLGAPYGEETILVVASEAQFPSIETDLASVALSRDSIAAVTDAARGINVAERAGAPAGTVNTRWTYTILESDKAQESVTWNKPDDVAAFLDAIRRDITGRGGSFDGNETAGRFSESGFAGSYNVNAKQIVFVFEEKETQTGLTRGLTRAHTFSVAKPADAKKWLSLIKNQITKNRGNFRGTEREGSFTVHGIAGTYTLGDSLNVSIFQKPRFIPNALIETEVKKYFLAK